MLIPPNPPPSIRMWGCLLVVESEELSCSGFECLDVVAVGRTNEVDGANASIGLRTNERVLVRANRAVAKKDAAAMVK